MKESDRRTTRVAVIGCGRIAWQLENDPLRYKPCTHLGALLYWKSRNKKISLTGFCDLQPENAIRAARFARADTATITTDYRDIIAQKPDLLVVATTTHAHQKILLAAVANKIPLIVAEKPLVFSAREVNRLAHAVKSGSSVILPNYERRYHVKYQKLRSEIQNDGKSHSYRAFFAAGGASLYANTARRDEGVLLHDTTHLVDLSQFLFGKIRRFRVAANSRKHTLFLEHENGSTGTLETSLGIGAFHLELEVHLKGERVIVGNGFTAREKIAASPHYKNLRGYTAPVRRADAPFATAKNPFVQLYHKALFGKPNNAHFYEALDNVEMLTKQR